MAAFGASIVVLLLLVSVLVFVARRRPPGQRLTWGEAFLAATFVFATLFVAYGVVPHQFLAMSDNVFKWRDDKIGIPIGGLAQGPLRGHWIFKKPYLLAPKGIPLMHGYFRITAQVLRDVLVTLLYGVLVGAQLFGWSWWQKRGKSTGAPEIEQSAYGRPLLRPVSGEGA